MADDLSIRLRAICDKAAVEVSILFVKAGGGKLRFSPAQIDQCRQALELAVRAAALEGARCHAHIGRALHEGRLVDGDFNSRTTRAALPAELPPETTTAPVAQEKLSDKYSDEFEARVTTPFKKPPPRGTF